MKNFHFKTVLLFVFMVSVFLSCERNANLNDLVENSETAQTQTTTPEGWVFVKNPDENPDLPDGISQEEVITPINVDVKIEDGVLVFKDFKTMLKGLRVLSQYNIESLALWANQLGLKSLFSEFIKMENLPVTEIETARAENNLNYLTTVRDGILKMARTGFYESRILNADGIVQVGEYVGTFWNGATIWTDKSNKEALIEAIKSDEMPDDDSFIVYKSNINQVENRDWVRNYNDCPTWPFFQTGEMTHVNPNANRRIITEFEYGEFSFPINPGVVDYTVEFLTESQSYKRCK